ncbi:glycosylhydrolase-like jelly roll fold domain-containing protein [Streptomyces sp. NBC_00120]|uniref:Glycosyl hydrolase n=1 Tax=Streptomyces sp. NBC_00119 TaxID=2975659 RepID=A0AAU1U0W1_9ACTN|nr:glycosylhydrolase-like jelly roll fold domain-containing protein [Streptomyces sp. NBC_00120]MCX5321990.1 glycosyl hydrolase [Streptomyces sp. NBC_00120]
MPEHHSALSRRGFVALSALTAAAVTGGLPGLASAIDRSGGFDPDGFADPRRDSRPAVYWYWNGPVTNELVETQMADLRAKGLYEVVVFPFDNAEMQPAFFTEGWFDVVGHVLDVAEKTGMKVWLFNDNHFPSGRAGYFITRGGTVGSRTYKPRPDLRLKGLWRSTAVVQGPRTVSLPETTGVGVDAGQLIADAAVLAGPAVLRAGDTWGDCTVTASAKADVLAAGLLVRASADGSDGLLVEFDQTGVVTLSRVADGAVTQVTRSTRTDGFNKTKFHTLAVTGGGANVSVTLDGKDKGTITDTTLTGHRVGVHARDGQRSLWEDLKVTGADGSALYTQTFDVSSAAGDFTARTAPKGVPAPAAATARPIGSADADDLVELTGRIGSGSWQVPEGEWQIDLFGGVELVDDSVGYARGYVDLLDDEPVELFLDIVPGEYHRRFRRYFGTVIKGFWDDEPFIASAAPHSFKRRPWSPTLAAALDTVGAEPGLAYASAFDDLGERGRVLRGRYWQAVSDRFSCYFEKQSEWYAERGVRLITNPLYDETAPSKRIASTGDLHKVNQWAQVPGGDCITAEYELNTPTMDPRNPASVAHQTGRPRVLMEMFGNMGWQIAPDFMRALVGAFATRGINLAVLHALWTDETHVYFAPPFGPRNPWWWAMPPVSAWIGRVMELARGTSGARTALLQPQRAAEQFTATARQGEVDDAFADAAYALERSQVDFDLVHEGALSGDKALLAHAETDGGLLRVGRAAYEVVVVPATPVLDAATVRTLTAFVRSGGTAVAVGAAPEFAADGDDKALERAWGQLFPDSGAREIGKGRAVRVAAPDGLGPVAHDAGVQVAVLEPAADAVRALRTTRGTETAFLFNNESGTRVTTTALLPADGEPELWNPATGTVRPVPVRGLPTRDGVRLPLVLDPYETLAVVVRAKAAAHPYLTDADGLPVTAVTRERQALRVTALADAPGTHHLTGRDGGATYTGTVKITDTLEPIPVDGDWTLTLAQDGAEPVTRPLGSWSDLARLYSGSGTYTKNITLDAAALDGRRLLLDLGTVREVAEVTVNGKEFGPVLWSPYVIDVTDGLKAGVNRLSVRVSNTLSNERNKPLPSGLLGPVVLRPRRPLTVDLAPSRA